MATPVETKVKASSAAAALAGLALWALGRYIFKGTVPDVVASWVYVIVPAVITFAAGYLAKHTNRPSPLVPLSIGQDSVTLASPSTKDAPAAPVPPQAGP